MFEKFARFIVKFRYLFIGIFALAIILSLFLIPQVKINYDIVKYLPDSSETKIAIQLMNDEFGSSGTAQVMLSNVTEADAEIATTIIQEIDGVASAVFDGTKTTYYNTEKNKALIQVFLTDGNYTNEAGETVNAIESALNDYKFAVCGEAVSATNNRNTIEKEIVIILLIAIAIIAFILLLTSRAWIEPIIFAIVIGCAILINMGTNILLGSISFVTQSISSIMLIALAMDYSIVLLHRYREEHEKYLDAKQAMVKAISGSFVAVLSSALTVMAGLFALVFMNFKIGFDMGMVLTKGVLISVIAVIFLMPAIIILFDKIITKTAHKSFLPSMDIIGKFAKKTAKVMPIIFLAIVIVGLCLQPSMEFSYVVKSNESGAVLQQQKEIEESFGIQNPLVILVEKEDINKQKAIALEVSSSEYINSANAMVLTQLYGEYTATSLGEMGLSSTTISSMFDFYDKDVSTEKLYVYELGEYLHFHNANLTTDFKAFIQTNYGIMYQAIPKSVAMTNYYLTEQQANDLYGSNTTIELSKLAIYICENNLLASANGDLVKLAGQANTQFTATELKVKYDLSNDEIGALYNLASKNVATDSIKNYELVYVLKNNTALVEAVCQKMQNKMEYIYASYVGAKEKLVGETYSRLIFNLNLAEDDSRALDFIAELKKSLKDKYDLSANLVNASYNILEMQDVFGSDRTKTDLITIFGILLIVLLAFRSVSIPVLLVLAIQGAIWINLGLNVVTGSATFFVCYLLAMAIQMGATIDYGILLTDRYVFARKKQNKYDAIKTAINKSFITVITSGAILVFAAFTIGWVSTTPIISEIGVLVGRGALISSLTILFVLPQLLLLFDKVINKTTYKAKFNYENQKLVEGEIKEKK